MALLKIFLLSLLISNSFDSWVRVETQQNISFLFPHKPEAFKKENDGMVSYVYQTKNRACVFGVVCTDFSNSRIPLTKESVLQVYELLRMGSVSMETAIMKDEKTLSFDGMLIKEIEYSIIKDNYEMTYFKRFIFRENMVYQISIGSRTRHMNLLTEEKEVFFNSISFKRASGESGADSQ